MRTTDEQWAYDNIVPKDTEFLKTPQDMAEFFGEPVWKQIVDLLKDKLVVAYRWGADDIAERGEIVQGLGPVNISTHSCGWQIRHYQNGVIEVEPQGSSGAGPVVINY
jgi:hypothetical protein